MFTQSKGEKRDKPLIITPFSLFTQCEISKLFGNYLAISFEQSEISFSIYQIHEEFVLLGLKADS